ncbi:MAG: hypothetical protein QOH31_1381 [Verrucomicrobiota bacterium]
METWDSLPLVTTGNRRRSSQFISIDDNLKADPQGFCCSADTLLRTKVYCSCPAITKSPSAKVLPLKFELWPAVLLAPDNDSETACRKRNQNSGFVVVGGRNTGRL